MWRSKKLIISVILATVLLAGSIGGIALAQTEDEDNGQPETRFGAMIERVCQIYDTNTDPDDLYPDLDPEALKAAFAEARSQMCAEFQQNRPEFDPEAMHEAMQERLKKLYDEGKISEEQYLEMQERIESMPDEPFQFGFRNHGGIKPFGKLFGGFGRFGGGFHGPGGPCAPEDS